MDLYFCTRNLWISVQLIKVLNTTFCSLRVRSFLISMIAKKFSTQAKTVRWQGISFVDKNIHPLIFWIERLITEINDEDLQLPRTTWNIWENSEFLGGRNIPNFLYWLCIWKILFFLLNFWKIYNCLGPRANKEY